MTNVASGMDDPPHPVAALARQVQRAVGAVELRAARQQDLERLGRVPDDGAHDIGVAQTRTRAQRILRVVFGGVLGGERDGEPALGEPRVGVFEVSLQENEHARVGRRRQRGGQSGDAAADHEDVSGVPGQIARVEIDEVSPLRRGSTQRPRLSSTCAPSAAARGSSARSFGVTR
jgi:hypothetical protein